VRQAGTGSSAQSPEVRKANAFCRRADPKIAAAEAIAPNVFTANATARGSLAAQRVRLTK